MDQCERYLVSVAEIIDTLIWSGDRVGPLVDALRIVREVTGATMAPAYLIDDEMTHQDLIASPEERALIGPELAVIQLNDRPGRAFVGQTRQVVEIHEDSPAWQNLAPRFGHAFQPPCVVVPVQADYRHLGVFILPFEASWQLDAPTEAFLNTVGRLFGQHWYRWMKTAREHELGALQERRRISEELHVNISQQVTALSLRLQMLRMDLDDPVQAGEDLALVDQLVNGIKRSLRSKMLGLRQDEALIRDGLVQTLRGHVEAARTRYELPVELTCPPEADRVPLQVAAQLVRVMQESLANACLHADCTRVKVQVSLPGTVVRLSVIDNGIGMDEAQLKSGRLGMRVMSERMSLVRGRVTLGRAEDGGTIVTAEAPVPERIAAAIRADGETDG